MTTRKKYIGDIELAKKLADKIIEVNSIDDLEKHYQKTFIRFIAPQLKLFGYYSFKSIKSIKKNTHKKVLIILKNGRTHRYDKTTHSLVELSK